MIAFLSNLKLTIIQWVGVVAAMTIGLLVLALRAQGSRLHKAQVELLASQLGRQTDAADEKVTKAKDAYKAALKAYKEAQ